MHVCVCTCSQNVTIWIRCGNKKIKQTSKVHYCPPLKVKINRYTQHNDIRVCAVCFGANEYFQSKWYTLSAGGVSLGYSSDQSFGSCHRLYYFDE